ncbi:MAG: hypothetical protein Q9219_002703 [cf. Caloplaca sp. 3 TL-2023]
MGDPITPSIGFVTSTAQLITKLNAVRDETGVVIDQVRVVTNDIAEAERLFLRKRAYLSDADKSRVNAVILSTKAAVHRIAKEVEPARKSVKKVGTVNVVDRFDWILRRSGSTETYQHNLETNHRSLLDRISMLRGVRPDQHDRAVTLPTQSSEGNREELLGYESDSEGDEDATSSTCSSTDTLVVDQDPEGTTSPTPRELSTNSGIHPERALHETAQLNHARKFNRQKPAMHPERLLYEEMQQRYKQKRHHD